MPDNSQDERLLRIPVEAISSINRGRKKLEGLAELGADILAQGQLQPGIVRRTRPDDLDPDGKAVRTPWILVAGGRRYAACCVAGIDTFLARDFGDLPPVQQLIIELHENLNRDDLDPFDEAEMRRRIHELYTSQAKADGRSWTLADTATELKTTNATMSRDIAVAKAVVDDPSLREMGSRKAVIRTLDMREHLARKAAAAPLVVSASQKLSSMMVQADAQTFLRALPAASVDLHLSDPPYAINYNNLPTQSVSEQSQTNTSNSLLSGFDDAEAVNFDLFDDVVPQVLRTTKSTGWICWFIADSTYPYLKACFEDCCATHFEYAEVTWAKDSTGNWERKRASRCPLGRASGDPCTFLLAENPRWIWYRPNSQNMARYPERHAKSFWESILVVNRGAGRLYKTQDACPNLLVCDAEYGSGRIHVHQKPRALARELVERFTLPGELVVDPFFGSGNLLAGAAEALRKIRGGEKNSKIIELAIGNVAQYYGG